METAICIPTFNRPEYLRQTLESLMPCLTDEFVVITDDNSTDMQVIRVIFEYLGDYKNKMIIRHPNFGIARSMKIAIENCKDKDVIISLDSDFIVHKDFIKVLTKLVTENPENIITSFNATSHKVIKELQDRYLKQTIGGGNIAFTWGTYTKYIQPILTNNAWDWQMCDMVKKAGKMFICTKPSLCQHIGINSTLGHDNTDTAADFKGYE